MQVATVSVRTPQAAAFLCLPQAVGYLAPFADQPTAIKAASEVLEVPLARLHHWVRRAHDLGLLHVAQEVKRAGRAVRLYQTVAREFRIPADLVPLGHFERGEADFYRSFVQALTVTAPALVQGGELHVQFDGGGVDLNVLADEEHPVGDLFASSAPAVLHTWSRGVRLSRSEAKRLQRELWAVLEGVLARQDDTQSPAYIVHLGLAPLPVEDLERP